LPEKNWKRASCKYVHRIRISSRIGVSVHLKQNWKP
jgi:hypothetical protein